VKPRLKPPRNKRLKLKRDILLLTSAFKFNLRRYGLGGTITIRMRPHQVVGRALVHCHLAAHAAGPHSLYCYYCFQLARPAVILLQAVRPCTHLCIPHPGTCLSWHFQPFL
jgi:hypothetical protein